MPPILGKTADIHNSTAFAMIVPVMFFVAAYSYPICVNFVPVYRDAADKVGASSIGLKGETIAENEEIERSPSDEKDLEKQVPAAVGGTEIGAAEVKGAEAKETQA